MTSLLSPALLGMRVEYRKGRFFMTQWLEQALGAVVILLVLLSEMAVNMGAVKESHHFYPVLSYLSFQRLVLLHITDQPPRARHRDSD
jgi:hypothetical protein